MPNRLFFIDAETIRAMTPGCPLRTSPPSSDESACAGCRLNAGYPGTPEIGCEIDIPADIVDVARATLVDAPWPSLLAGEVTLSHEQSADVLTAASDAVAGLQSREGVADLAGLLSHPSSDVRAVGELCSWVARMAFVGVREREAIRILG